MPLPKRKTKAEQIAYYKAKIAALESPEKSDVFEEEVKKQTEALVKIYESLKKATGKERAVDTVILKSVATAMGMRGMVITKKVQQRKPK
jgi:hypothetical protein